VEQGRGGDNAVGKIRKILPGDFGHLHRDILVERHVLQDGPGISGRGMKIIQGIAGMRPFSMR